MKDLEKQFENFTGQIKFDDMPSPAHRDRLEKNLLQTLARRQSPRPKKLWRIIMKSQISKLAAVAVIIVSVIIGLATILKYGATPAYAIEQTIEAIKNVPIVHIFGRDSQNKQIEMWIQVNPNTGLMEYCYINHIDDEKLTISTPKNTYRYDKLTNTVRLKDGPSVSSIFRLGQFFDDIKLFNDRFNGRITHNEVFDPNTRRNLIELKITSSKLEVMSLIDPQTKLPISVDIIRGEKLGYYEILKHADHIHYDDLLPEKLFDFTIPLGATIISETIEDAVQKLPGSVIQYCVQFHIKTIEEAISLQVITVNTQIYLVDNELNLRRGGFIGIYNFSNEVWTGEVSVSNFDWPNLAVFDENGKKQQIRLVQQKQFSPGRFRLYWKLEEPLSPGQAKGGIYWINDPKKITQKSPDRTFKMLMENTFGTEAIENFILILPMDFTVINCSSEYISKENIDKYSIYIWQRHLPKERITNSIDITIEGEKTN